MCECEERERSRSTVGVNNDHMTRMDVCGTWIAVATHLAPSHAVSTLPFELGLAMLGERGRPRFETE
jgi:hypothetical protein